jgi:hypothetical protein
VQGVVQGIPAVLLPPGFKTAPADLASKTAAEKGQLTATSPSGGRRLLGSGIDTVPITVMPFNAAETEIRSKTRSMFRDAELQWG